MSKHANVVDGAEDLSCCGCSLYYAILAQKPAFGRLLCSGASLMALQQRLWKYVLAFLWELFQTESSFVSSGHLETKEGTAMP